MQLVRIALMSVVTFAAVWVVGFVAAQWRMEDTVEAFDRASLTGVPAKRTNDAAQRVSLAAFSLGLPLSVRGETKLQADGPLGRSPMVRETRSYVTERLENPNGTTALPEPVREFLVEYDGGLEALDAAVDSGQPEWTFKPEQGVSGPLPNLHAHMTAARLYTLRALLAADEGRTDEAWQHLEREWVLARSLLDHPVLITRLIAIAEVRQIALASIQINSPAPGWMEEVHNLPVADILMEAAQWEAHALAAYPDPLMNAPGRQWTFIAAATLTLAEPVRMWRATSAARDLTSAASTWKSACADDPTPDESPFFASVRNMPARIEGTLHQLELARLVHEARSGRAAQPREICGSRWTITPDGSGGIVLELLTDLPPDEAGLELRRVRISL